MVPTSIPRFRCSQFRLTVALDHCVHDCPFSARPGGKRCSDVAKQLAALPDTSELIKQHTPSAAFQKAFPEVIRGERVSPTTRHSTVRHAKSVETPPAPVTAKPATESVADDADDTEYVPHSAAIAAENDETKETLMSGSTAQQADTERLPATDSAPVGVEVATRKKRGPQPGSKRGPRKAVSPARLQNALVVFVESEPGSGLYRPVTEGANSSLFRELFTMGAQASKGSKRILVSLDTSDFGA